MDNDIREMKNLTLKYKYNKTTFCMTFDRKIIILIMIMYYI